MLRMNIYSGGNDGKGRLLVAKARYAEDAAAIMVLGVNRYVTWGNRIVLDGRKPDEYGMASNSYDAAAALMCQRFATHQQLRQERLARANMRPAAPVQP